MDATSEPAATGLPLGGNQRSGTIILTRFTVPADQRLELITAATRSVASSPAGTPDADWSLLAELEGGDWLAVSITSPSQVAAEDAPFLDLADRILGDESGAIVACVRLGPN